jgi:carboxypeptidase C (cathepsin A)
VPVTVYQGQLDLICCTLGVNAWMEKLAWDGMAGFRATQRKPIYMDLDRGGDRDVEEAHREPRRGILDAVWHRQTDRQTDRSLVKAVEGPQQPAGAASVHDIGTMGFVKEYKNLAMYIILDAGHMVPADQPSAALALLSRLLRKNGDDGVTRAGRSATAVVQALATVGPS